MRSETMKGLIMQRYFECYGINREGKFDTQYVSFNKMFGMFGNDRQTFSPKKTELKKHSEFKAIHYFRVVDGVPIYDDNKKLVKVNY